MNATKNTSAPSYPLEVVVDLFNIRGDEILRVITSVPPPNPLPGFVTFFDPGWSIVRLRAAVAKQGTIFYSQSWYDREPFANLDESPRYRQLRMTAAPDSFCRTFAEQQTLLPADEEIPSARVVVMGMVIHFLATGERLFADDWVRCVDKDSHGDRVRVGDSIAGGLGVRRVWDGSHDSRLGLSAARKF
jgi:hypothetical protein